TTLEFFTKNYSVLWEEILSRTHFPQHRICIVHAEIIKIEIVTVPVSEPFETSQIVLVQFIFRESAQFNEMFVARNSTTILGWTSPFAGEACRIFLTPFKWQNLFNFYFVLPAISEIVLILKLLFLSQI